MTGGADRDAAAGPGADTEALLRRRLTDAFAPTELQIKDQSHLHAGHAGAAGGGRHFQIAIVAEQFAGLPRLRRHQMIYDALGDLMTARIHALSIRASAPSEQRSA